MINHNGTQLITTNRLTLRRFTTNDSRDVYEKWAGSYDSRFWSPPHKNMEETGLTATLFIPYMGYRNIELIRQIGCKWLVRICGSGKEIEVYEDEFQLD